MTYAPERTGNFIPVFVYYGEPFVGGVRIHMRLINNTPKMAKFQNKLQKLTQRKSGEPQRKSFIALCDPLCLLGGPLFNKYL